MACLCFLQTNINRLFVGITISLFAAPRLFPWKRGESALPANFASSPPLGLGTPLVFWQRKNDAVTSLSREGGREVRLGHLLWTASFESKRKLGVLLNLFLFFSRRSRQPRKSVPAQITFWNEKKLSSSSSLQ